MLSSSIGIDPSPRASRAIGRLGAPDSPAHAVLIYGAVGSGKGALANGLAKSWMCLKPSASGACGECRSCAAFERGNSSDLLVISPGSGNIIQVKQIDPSREGKDEFVPLREFLRTAPLASARKVVLITEADRMHPATANALLKSLEEPPPYGRLILITSEIAKLPTTIVSRCVAVACELPTHLDSPDWPEGIALAEGSPGLLAAILACPEPYREIHQCAGELTTAQTGSALVLAERFRNACDSLGKLPDWSARAANVEGLRALGAALRSLEARPDWLQKVAEAHRRVLGNGSMGAATDELFAGFLT